MKNWFKQNSTHLLIVVSFIILVFFYFTPVWQGKSLIQSDVIQAQASQKELFDYKAQDGKTPLWTNSMFGGMPTYQIWAEQGMNVGTYVLKVLKTVFPPPMDVVLLYLLGGYFLFSVLRIRPWLAAVGAIAVAFTSYNFIYIEAGHMNKAYAIAFMAPVVASVILCFRGNKLWGTLCLAIFMALELRVNHYQMTYYLFLGLLVYVIIELYYAIKQKQLKPFLQAAGLQLGAVILAIGVNASAILTTYEYSKLTIRGKANIVKVDASESGKGLDKTYAYEWSQGMGETITFLIPNAYGGASSGEFDKNSEVVKFFVGKGVPEGQAIQMSNGSIPSYWGEKRFTSGPWYFGAGVFFLFVLGLFIVNGRIKWWILSTSILVVLLSFGRHFPLVSDLFFDYFPMYNKFRAVESILVILALLVPIMAVLAVNEIFNRKDQILHLDKKVLYTFIGLGGLCLLIGLLPELFLSLKTSGHANFVEGISQQIGDRAMGNELVAALIKDRAALASHDAFRSFAILLITFLTIWFYIQKKASSTVVVGILAVVFLADLWSVDKRYLNDNVFVDAKTTSKQVFVEREVDQLIRLDKDLSYRVLDLSTNPFSDARASYFHKSLGGYHAAKLMRFQEILENQFNGALNEDVLDMFNVRYLITADAQGTQQRVSRRSSAAGNAWFVNRVTFVKDNAQEMQAISSFDPLKEAFVHEEFKDKINASRLGQANNGTINLVAYHPDHMQYEYSTPNDAFAVFSEVYYDKGWKAYVDGEEHPIVRADYILRGLQLPGGNHKVEFKFEPQSHVIGDILSGISSIILVAGLGILIFLQVRNKKKVA